MEDRYDQYMVGLFLVKNDMTLMLVPPQSRPNEVSAAANARMLRNHGEAAVKLQLVFDGLISPEGLPPENLDIEQFLLCSLADAEFSHTRASALR